MSDIEGLFYRRIDLIRIHPDSPRNGLLINIRMHNPTLVDQHTSFQMMMNMSSCQSFQEVAAPAAINSNVSGWMMKRKNHVNHGLPPAEQWHQEALAVARKHLLGEFNRRFFWMDFNINLVYYAESPSAKRVAFIPFSRLRHVEVIASPVKINHAKTGWVYGLTLRTVNRSLDLWAKTEKEQLMWVEAFQKAIGDSAVNASVMLTRGSTLSFPVSESDASSMKNENQRWSDNSQQTKQSLPPIKEAGRWAEPEESDTVPAPVVTKTGSKWDDWDN